MVTVRIGSSERELRYADETWIKQQINGLLSDGKPVCIRIFIKYGSVNVSLSTKDCQDCKGASRPPNVQEKRIFELWSNLGLDKSTFRTSDLIAFLRHVGD